jgi:hypothetical protein
VLGFLFGSRLLLTKEKELRRAQREKQISQAATRRFSAKPKAILH